MKQHLDIILASGSPRRKELLEQAGLTFQIIKSEKEEIITKTDPIEVVQELAHQKAEDVANSIDVLNGKKMMIIGSDTVVVNDDKILGKPKDEADALDILMSLSGRAHAVYTGVSVIIKDEMGMQSTTFAERTNVYMYPFTKEDALQYIGTKEPMDKAGAYGIQGLGGVLVEKIEGDYNNVVGFPLSSFVRMGMENGYFEM